MTTEWKTFHAWCKHWNKKPQSGKVLNIYVIALKKSHKESNHGQ